MKKLSLVVLLGCGLLGCPDKAAETKPDPAAAAAKTPTKTAPAAASAPKAGGGW